MKKNILILLTLMLIVSVSSIAGCVSNPSTPKQPQKWVDINKIYGLGDINHNTYTLNFQGVNYSIFRVGLTHSMLPTLPDGSMVIVINKFNASKLKVGDIITFSINGIKVVHRIDSIGLDNLGFFFKTKGDNNLIQDSWKVRPNNIDGVVVGVIW